MWSQKVENTKKIEDTSKGILVNSKAPDGHIWAVWATQHITTVTQYNQQSKNWSWYKQIISNRRRGGSSLQQNSIQQNFHCSFYKYINLEGTIEIFKSPFGKHHNNYFKQESLIHAITGRQKYEKHNIYVTSKYLPTTCIY